MTAISSTKSLKASVASALVLSALATTPACAQTGTSATPFGTVGTYVPTGTDLAGVAVVTATGNSKTLAAFQSTISKVFTTPTASKAGGDITFDDATAGQIGTSIGSAMYASYGAGGSKTMTITGGAAQLFDVNTNNGTSVTSAGATGNTYLGANGTAPTDYQFAFSQSLSDFGIMALNRGAERDLTFQVTLLSSTGVVSTVTPETNFVTSATAPTFFEYTAGFGQSITQVDFLTGVNGNTNTGFVRFDDLAFATPEPSQYAGLGLGVLGLGLLALKARKRTALGS